MGRIKCRNPLCSKDEFYTNRKDQKFCSTSCRNQFNNEEYKRQKKVYKAIADGLQWQDKVIAAIIKNNPQVFVKQEDFIQLGIDISKAIQVVYDMQGYLKKAVYVKFEISNYKTTIFKIQPR